MNEERKKAVPVSPVGAGGAQPYVEKSNEIISNADGQCNLQAAEKSPEGQLSGGAEALREARVWRGDLAVVSMTELYETVYPPRTPIVDDLLYAGTYLFCGRA